MKNLLKILFALLFACQAAQAQVYPDRDNVAVDLKFSSAAAKIIPGATSLTLRNNADNASNMTMLEAGDCSLKGPLTLPTSTLGFRLGAASVDSDVSGAFGVPAFYLINSNTSQDAVVNIGTGNNATGTHFYGAKTRSTAGDANVIVQQNDELFNIGAFGSDGVNYRRAAAIVFSSDGVPGASDMPGRIDLQTTADGTQSLVTHESINNAGKFTYTATNTAGGTTGAQTINKTSGTVNLAAAATTLVVTNSLVTTSSICFAVVRTADTTAAIKNVVPAAGSFTITLSAAATAETSVGFRCIN